jgi:pimeloyl-ACP methyl ester carboxylesterase
MNRSLHTSTEIGSSLDGALKEIQRRAPDYLVRFPLCFTTPDEYYHKFASHYPETAATSALFFAKFDEGVEHVRRRGARVEKNSSIDDPVAGMLSEAIVDAIGFEDIDTPAGSSASEFRSRFEQSYDEGRTKGGRRYFIRKRGETALLLITALGVPLYVWSRFLLDPDHEFRIVLVDARSSDIFLGGMTEQSSIGDDGADIADVISNLGLIELDVVAWCNGAKIALELLSGAGAKIRSLTLISPSLSGPCDARSDQSAYEYGLRQVVTAVCRKPDMAPLIARGLDQLTRPVDWDGVSGQGHDRAQVLFNLPAQDYAAALKCPFSSIDSLRKYARRGQDDYEYPTAQRLRNTGVPCLLVTGAWDQVVNNRFVAGVMSGLGRSVTHAIIRGAGHYTFDLQYPYFKSILTEFIERRAPKARVRVEFKNLESNSLLE